MKFLLPLALLAGAANALFGFTNDIPVDAYYDEGSDFKITWTPQDRNDTFRLELYTFLVDPIYVGPSPYPWGFPIYDYNETTTVLDAEAKYNAGSFTWHIDLIEGREGPDWYYRFGAQLGTVGEVADYARAFHIQAQA
ncbi:hypothetical protein NPX13_g943 [Xylaria arbuscula]|uniref:Uncharacterized protein n=1 Tax=Xylaria arbuscula TaxID=114810 RepID=A0A9W8TQ28_9PEZI|nr:hypothetical protein NPX13_g943 [Xylaria arbuscula]